MSQASGDDAGGPVAQRGSGEPQLSGRALVAGVVLGGLLCLSNLYVSLKTGWSLGVTLTASVAGWAAFAAARRLGITRRSLGPLENNAACSVASAAAFMTGGGNLAALPAILLLTGAMPSTVGMAVWFALVAALGVVVAIPLRRQLIDVEALPFPTGTATAAVIRSLHDGQSGGARPLLGAALCGGATALLRDAPWRWLPLRLPALLPLPLRLRGYAAGDLTLAVEPSLLLVGAGGLIGLRTSASILVGAVVNFAVLAPALIERGAIAAPGYRAIVAWSVWPAAGLLSSSALVALCWQWRLVGRSLGLVVGLAARPAAGAAPSAGDDCPRWWFPAGVAALGPAVAFTMCRLFAVPWWAGLLALPLALLMAVVAARATGETDVTPTQALGPLTQAVFGAVLPGHVAGGLAGANSSAGVGLHAADLLTDLKSGHLLGARPRSQVVAQLVGVLTGAALVSPCFALLVRDPSVLGSAALPAPSAMVWAGVARALASGAAALEPTARTAGLCGLLLGALLTVLERLLPPRLARLVPSPTGLGVALVMPAWNALALFLGSALGAAYSALRPAGAARTLAPLASGLIAGESLIGIALALAFAARSSP